MTPGHGDLADYLIGALSGLAADGVEEHLAQCEPCARELEQLVWVSELLAQAGAVLGGPPATEPYPEGPVAAEPPCAPVGRAPGAGLTSRTAVVPYHVRTGRVHASRCAHGFR
jgi:anti-sigma factor RsiW